MMNYNKRIKDDITDSLIAQLDSMIDYVREVKNNNSVAVYTNASMKENLGVSDKLLSRYRNDGLLPYSRVDDKYWYTSQDVNTLMSRTKIDAFAY